MSRECAHTSMAGSRDIPNGEFGLIKDGLFKIPQLRRRKDNEEGLEQHDSLPEAGIEVVVARVHLMPAALWVGTDPLGKVVGGGAKVPVQIFHHFFEGADFMEKLEPVGKEHPVQEPAHPRGALAPRSVIVLWVQGCGTGNGPKVLGMVVQCSEGARERPSETLAQIRAYGDGAQGFCQKSCAFELDGLVQGNAEHVVEQFKKTFMIMKYLPFLVR